MKYKAFDEHITKKNNEFKEEMLSLEDLRLDIARQVSEVRDNISVMSKESSEWAFANNLTSCACKVAKASAFDAYNRWMAVFPVVQIWMSMEPYAMAAVESGAQLEGFSEELLAHIEAKHVLQRFTEAYRVFDYDKSSSSSSSSEQGQGLNHSLGQRLHQHQHQHQYQQHLQQQKQTQEHRKGASEAYIHLHMEQLRRRSRLINDCERVKADIARKLILK